MPTGQLSGKGLFLLQSRKAWTPLMGEVMKWKNERNGLTRLDGIYGGGGNVGTGHLW